MLEYLKKRSLINANTNCWEWTGGLDSWGYGQFFKNKTTHKAHRTMYKEIKGEIPKGFFVCHTCDNPKCINPDHLWLGTPKENANDRDKKGRHHKFIGEQHPAAKLTWKDVREIHKNADNLSQVNLATLYNVSIPTINDVVKQRCWKEENDPANYLRTDQTTA